MRCKKRAFTLVELLTVLAIVALLIGLLIPSLTMIRNSAREAKQKAQLTEIGLALTAFRNDYGDYPPSNWRVPPGNYCGAQKLAEALLGWDLMGFHPKSAWLADGYDGLAPNGPLTYDPDKVRDVDVDGVPDTFGERRGAYLELGTEGAFKLGDLFGTALTATTPQLAANTFVICDAFGVKKITIAPGQTTKAGMPVLYYKADTTRKIFGSTGIPPGSGAVYNCNDNLLLIQVADMEDGTPGDHWLFTKPPTYPAGTYFYSNEYKIMDQKIFSATAKPWPHRADSYILISAGMDGLYGTADDILNFGK